VVWSSSNQRHQAQRTRDNPIWPTAGQRGQFSFLDLQTLLAFPASQRVTLTMR
jgi:hypothetical protein